MGVPVRSRTAAGAPLLVAKLGWVGPFNDTSRDSHPAASATTAAATIRLRDRNRATRCDNLNRYDIVLHSFHRLFPGNKKGRQRSTGIALAARRTWRCLSL